MVDLKENKRLPATTSSTAPLLAGSSMLIVTSAIGWLVTPLQGKIKGYAFPILNRIDMGVGLNNPLEIGSFGLAVVVLGILIIFSTVFRAPARLLFYLGGATAAVCVIFIGKLLFANAEMIESYIGQTIQANNIRAFSSSYLEGNANFLKPDTDVTTDSLGAKIEVGIGCLGAGWYLALASALCILIGSYQQRTRSMKYDVAGIAIILIVMSVGLSARTLRAEYDRFHGNLYLAKGRVEKAIELYRSAASWDPALSFNSRYVHNLGAAYYTLGQHDRPESHVYLGNNLVSNKAFAAATRAYEMASALKPDMVLAQRKRVEALNRMGIDNYGKGKIYTALSNWRKALQLDPAQIQVHFFMAKALLDINTRDQSQARAEAHKILEKTRDKLVIADAYVLLGDSYYKEKDFLTAREMYSLSKSQYQLVKRIVNFAASRGLQGI
ncbi:MAG: tetratricopeptide repeat protein [Gammaproteobacteria bacterium]